MKNLKLKIKNVVVHCIA